MRHSLPTTLLLVAFIVLTLCSWGFFMVETGHAHAAHYDLLASMVTTQILSLFFFVLMAGLLAATHRSEFFIASVHHIAHRIAWPFRRPLQLAFSDGILNTKAY